MRSNILPVAALAGAAMAACPLSVAIVGSVDHIAHVAVTNTGSEALTVFKGNTVFSEHSTKDLSVSVDGKDLPFEGAYINYKKTGVSPDMFQVIEAGETITASVNAAKTYKLAGVAEAKITALQGFKYTTGSVVPTSLKGLSFCEAESAEATITPDLNKVAAEHISARAEPRFSGRIQKRSVTYSSCTTAQTTSLKTSVADAISMSSKAYTAANTGADYFTTWFISTSQESKVRTIYNDVVNVQTTSPTISCTDTYGDCSDGSALLYTVPSDNVIIPCPSNGFWGFPEYETTCANDDYDRAGSILHEMTHLYGTDDYAYGPTAAKKLTAAKASANADTYEMYAGSVRLGGCS